MCASKSSSSVSTPLRSRCRIGFGLIGAVEIFGASSLDPGVCWVLDNSSRLLTIKITSCWWDGATKTKCFVLFFVYLILNNYLIEEVMH